MSGAAPALVAAGAMAAFGFGGAAAGATAQEVETGSASAWLPWIGCWVEVGAPASEPMLCLVPDDGGATLLTVSRSGEVERQSLRADGTENAVAAGGCVGAEALEPSRDGSRLYLRSRLACEGETERTTRGLMAIVGPDRWVRVRAMTVGEASVAWVTRYRSAPSARVADAVLEEMDAARSALGPAVEAARAAAAGPISVDDIIEAHARTEPEAVRAWIAEQGHRIRLDGDRLIRMADAGVSREVIDVAIAVSYPERFAVAHRPGARAGAADDWDRGGYARRHGMRANFYDPFFYDPFFYDPFYHRYGYNAYGYHRGLRGGGFGYGPTIVVVRPADDSRSSGRAVKGRGYTRSNGGSVSRPSSRSTSRGAAVRGTGTSTRSSPPSSSSSSGSKGKAKPKPRGGG